MLPGMKQRMVSRDSRATPYMVRPMRFRFGNHGFVGDIDNSPSSARDRLAVGLPSTSLTAVRRHRTTGSLPLFRPSNHASVSGLAWHMAASRRMSEIATPAPAASPRGRPSAALSGARAGGVAKIRVLFSRSWFSRSWSSPSRYRNTAHRPGIDPGAHVLCLQPRQWQ